MNKYGKRGVPAAWDAIKALWCSGEKTAKEIGGMFGVKPNTIETRASRENWYVLRDKVIGARNPRTSRANARHKNEDAPISAPLVTVSSRTDGSATRNSEFTDAGIIARASEIAGSERFRTRVIAANENALKVLEQSPPANIGECDRFAEALTKVERIGARTYGYDRETDRPVVNIAMLSGSGEYSLD